MFNYNGRIYNIINTFNYNGHDFSICENGNEVTCFKHNVVNNKDIYTPFDRWIQAFPNENFEEEKKKLDNYLSKLNRKKHNKKTYLDKNLYTVDNTLKKNKKIGIKSIYIGVLSFSLIFLFVGMISLINWYKEGKEVNTLMDNVLETTEIDEIAAFSDADIPELAEGDAAYQKYGEDYWKYLKTTMINVDFDELLKINPDTKGWINIKSTNVNYPFVQSGDNSFYLTHSFDKSNNVAGWLFADYKSDLTQFKKNTVIYGHGRVDKVMFGSLEKTLDPSWYTNEDNKYIRISTPEKNTMWQIFSLYTIPAESYYLTHTFENNDSYDKFLKTMKSRSIYDFGTSVTTKDKILTISTCLDTRGNRIVMQAKLVKEQSR